MEIAIPLLFSNPLPEDNLGYSVLLSLDNGKSYGSGFRLKHKSGNYLVTCKHVLFNDGVLRCENLLLTCQSGSNHDDEPLILEIDMTKAKVLCSTINDVAAIKLGSNENLYASAPPLHKDTSSHKRPATLYGEEWVTLIQKGTGRAVSVDPEATRVLNEIKIANDVYLMGYPTSLGLKMERYFDATKPLLRKGIIAGIDLKKHTFIIDCASYYGNSGGPIIEAGEDGYFRVIGLVSKYIPFEIEWKNSREPITHKEVFNSGYSVCVPMDAVYNLIEKDK